MTGCKLSVLCALVAPWVVPAVEALVWVVWKSGGITANSRLCSAIGLPEKLWKFWGLLSIAGGMSLWGWIHVWPVCFIYLSSSCLCVVPVVTSAYGSVYVDS